MVWREIPGAALYLFLFLFALALALVRGRGSSEKQQGEKVAVEGLAVVGGESGCGVEEKEAVMSLETAFEVLTEGRWTWVGIRVGVGAGGRWVVNFAA